MSLKKTKKKGQDVPPEREEDKPTKLDYSIASYMKKNTPTKRTKFLHHQVNYFYAAKAIDVLLDSPWASGKEPVFTDRQSVVDYNNRLLAYKFFHRAKKIPITDRDLKPKELKKKREREEKEKSKKENEKRKKKKDHSESKDESEDPRKEDDRHTEEEREDGKKKKKKIKLDMHLEQVFVDGSDAYVWMYDPVPFWYYIAGAMCLLAAVAICLFPLWPPSVRKGVYYLSVAAAGFLGVILGLAVVRFVVFFIIWMLSMGRHHLWLLPNLTEDVGFFASFWPLYHYEYRGADYDRKKSKKSKKKVVLKTSSETEDDAKKSDKEGRDTDRQETDGERRDEQRSSQQSNSDDSENSQHSQPFEMVDRDELDDEQSDGSEDEQGSEDDEGFDRREEREQSEDDQASECQHEQDSR